MRKAITKKKTGRPTKYQESYAQQAHQLCLLGATDKDLARALGVSRATIKAWKHSQPEFLAALKSGKDEADANVADRLYARAMGFEHPETKILQHGGNVIKVETTKRYPPDTTAGIFWLKNRRPEYWRDDKHINVTTTEKQELIVNLPPELARMLKIDRGDIIEGEAAEVVPDPPEPR